MILSWAVCVSIEASGALLRDDAVSVPRHRRARVHGCSAAAWGDPADPESPGFFPRNTTLCRCGTLYPSNHYFFKYIIYLIPVLTPGNMKISGFFPISFQRYRKMLWMVIVQSLSASCMLYAGYFCQRYSNADQAAGCNCSVYPWCRHEQKK